VNRVIDVKEPDTSPSPASRAPAAR
jgi:hypothetical protein